MDGGATGSETLGMETGHWTHKTLEIVKQYTAHGTLDTGHRTMGTGKWRLDTTVDAGSRVLNRQFLNIGHGTLDPGYRGLDTGHRTTGHRILDTGHMYIGFTALDIGYWTIVHWIQANYPMGRKLSELSRPIPACSTHG